MPRGLRLHEASARAPYKAVQGKTFTRPAHMEYGKRKERKEKENKDTRTRQHQRTRCLTGCNPKVRPQRPHGRRPPLGAAYFRRPTPSEMRHHVACATWGHPE